MARRLAILIGNQNFAEASGFAPLRGPHNDVDALARLLTDQARGDFELAVPELKDAKRTAILSAIEQTLRDAGRDDVVFIHYSGHGKPDRTGRLYLAASDSEPESLIATAVSASDLHEMAVQSNCRAVVLLLDCCYAGAIGKVWNAGLRSSTDELWQQRLRETMKPARGLFILTSSTSWQTSEEVESVQDGTVMGRFTRAIIERLEANPPHLQRDVYFSDLAEHVRGSFQGQDARHFILDAEGDPLIARVVIRQTPAERRQGVLAEWFRSGLIQPEVYYEAFQAAGGEGADAYVDLVQRLLDVPRPKPQPFLAAWTHALLGQRSPPESVRVVPLMTDFDSVKEQSTPPLSVTPSLEDPDEILQSVTSLDTANRHKVKITPFHRLKTFLISNLLRGIYIGYFQRASVFAATVIFIVLILSMLQARTSPVLLSIMVLPIAYSLYLLRRFDVVGVLGADSSVAEGIDYRMSMLMPWNSFSFLGTGAAKLTDLPEFEDAVVRCHRDNHEIKLLLARPDNPILRDAAKRQGYEPAAFFERHRRSLQKIAQIRDTRSANISVRFYKAEMSSDFQRFRLFFVDDHILLCSFNVYGQDKDMSFPQMYIRKKSGKSNFLSFYFAFEQYFNQVWETAEVWNFKQFLNEEGMNTPPDVRAPYFDATARIQANR